MRFVYVGLGYLLMLALFVALGYGFYALYDYSGSIAIILPVLYLLNLVFGLIILTQRRHNAAKVSWLVTFLALPLIGHAIFLIFSQRYPGRMSREAYLQKPSFKHEKVVKHNDELFSELSAMSHRGVYDAEIKLYERGDLAYQALFADLRAAKKTICLQYYIIKPGEIYAEFKTILLERAKAGVEVYFIIDDFGQWGLPAYEIRVLQAGGVKVSIFNRVHFPFLNSRNGYRNHRKVAIIDGAIAHAGGLNIANEYANISPRYGLWIDYQIRVTGSGVTSFNLLFQDDWKLSSPKNDFLNLPISHKTNIHTKTNAELILIEDSPERRDPQIQDALITIIQNAKKSISLASPYLILTTELEGALRIAAHRGVEIKLFIPGKPDKSSVFIASKLYAYYMAELGIKIYSARDMLIHTKMGLIDNKYAYFGTNNLDYRSTYSQFEIMAVTKGEIVKSAAALFGKYEKLSEHMTVEKLKKPKWKLMITHAYVAFFAPLF